MENTLTPSEPPLRVLLVDESFERVALLSKPCWMPAKTQSTVAMVTHDVDEAVLLSDRIVMMTNGPAATIGEILNVNLPRPRERLALANNPKYHECRGAVLDFLYRRQLRPAA